jgi:hypothetical protein
LKEKENECLEEENDELKEENRWIDIREKYFLEEENGMLGENGWL